MEGIRTYLLGVIAAAIICGIATRLLGNKGMQGAMAKLLTGLFLTFILIRPIAELDIKSITDFTSGYSYEAEQAAAQGAAVTKEALAESIKSRTEAYILDKAAAMNADLAVEVTLSKDDIPVPEAVRLTGKVSPYAKAQLSHMILEDLGIDKERQTWI